MTAGIAVMRTAPLGNMTEVIDYQRPRILRIYNIYRVILGFFLAVLTSSGLRDGLLNLNNPQLYEMASWFYLFINVLIALLLHQGKRDVHLFVLSVLDIFLLGSIFYAAGGAGSGFGNLLLIPVAAGNILLHGRVGLLLPALASLVIIYLTFYLSLSSPSAAQSYLQVGVLGCIYFAVALFVQRVSKRLRQSESLAHQQAASLASLEKLNQLIIQRMRTGILVVGRRQKVLLANEAAAQMLGKPIMRDDNAQVAQQAQQLKLASLGRLTASIAHEIRNPLGAISHAAQLLSESEQLPAQDKRLSDIIQQHSKRMNKVIETVLELSRRRASEPQLVDLALWLEQFADTFAASHTAADRLELTIEQPGIMTRMDPGQLNQVVDNLCSNALRYSGISGEPRTVWLKLYVHPESDLPMLEVIDHGPGIADEHIGHIFEPFYTTESSGTGLGLYISRELCESNQARLEYEPLVPRGSCMRITFAHPRRLV